MDRVRKKVAKTTAKEKSFLPDEIIRNILIRLPVKSVMRCRLVCRGWRDITLARVFVDLHLGSSIPVVLVTISKSLSILDLFAIDEWWEPAKTRFTIHRFPFHSGDYFPTASYAVFSQAGLIVFKGSPGSKFIILNPTRPSCENLTITLCEEFRGNSYMCALYYHPLLKDYFTMWKIVKSRTVSRSFFDQSEITEYKLLNLGSNPSMRTISNPFDYRLKDHAKSLFIDGYLYWLLQSNKQEFKYGGYKDILAFDIISEEFMVISCPVPLNTECMSEQTHLVNNDGILSFVLILPSTITIWRLENLAQQLWTSTEYSISLEIFCLGDKVVGMSDVVNGKLAFHSRNRFFVCNLMEGTVKNIPKKKYTHKVSFFSHQMSLASLQNCKSDMFINKDYKVLV